MELTDYFSRDKITHFLVHFHQNIRGQGRLFEFYIEFMADSRSRLFGYLLNFV